ncbi:UDP-N-acetylmuramate dehydrogenase [Patescibacteria group bacterium]|jgi:UDP-N-acetylmuramate dehydrogenase|nr:UDP-N-acetylmuramate dehydrogenase [Patescibacteria group bacterium]
MKPLTTEQIAAYRQSIPAAKEGEPMDKHTSFRVGGAARLYVVANTPDEIMNAVHAAVNVSIPWYVYGGGSNLLVNDDGYEGVIIQAANREIKIDGETVMAEAGAITGLVARQTVAAGLGGFEWAVGVPGTIGGAIYGDAGCYGGEMRDVVVSVDAYRIRDRQRVTLTNEQCKFGYRSSMFKYEPHLIFGCTLKLKPSADVEASKKRMDEIMQMRKEKQPLESSSAGCVFKNVEFDEEKDLEILKRSIEVPQGMIDKKQISVGWLIEQAGLMGQCVGEVEVSKKHGNFFINKGKARAQDILALISIIKMKVRDDLGIELQEEVQYVGF